MVQHGVRAAVAVGVTGLLVQIAWAQPQPAPEGEGGAAPAVDEGGQAEAAEGGSAEAPPQPPPQPPPDPVPDEDVDDIWAEAEKAPYVAPMVDADFSQQPEGITHWEHHQHRFVWNNLTAVRVNPLGLTNRFRAGYRGQISNRPEPIFDESFWSAQLDTEITPAFGYVGGRLELQPVALVNLFVSYGVVGSFGSFSYTRSFPDVTVDYSDETLQDTRDQDYATVGQRATMSALFQFGLAGWAIRNHVQLHWTDWDLRPGDRVSWDATLDLLVPDGGFVVTNDADMLVLTEFDLKFGVRYTLTAGLYDAADLAGGPNLTSPHHRIGPAVLYTFFEDPVGTMWNKPTLVLLAQWWVAHHYRDTDKPALPYLVLGFIQEGDFLVSDKE